jgi:tetratricopeptide (TPR) repeat protein
MGDKRLASVLVLVAVAGVAAVSVRLARRPAKATPLAALGVEVSGCEEITRAPACATSPGSELRLWIPGSRDASFAASADGRALAATVTAWPDGETLRVVVPEGATRLEVRSEGDAGTVAGWSIPLIPAWADSPRVAEARALRKAGRLDEAAAVLASTSGRADAGAGHSSEVALLALVEYARGHIDDAVARFREAIALHDAEGRWSAAVEDAHAFAFLLLERGRFGEVRPLLAEAAAHARDWGEGRALVTYTEGLLAWDTGDLRSALRLTREAEDHAARLGEERLRRMTVQSAARELLDLGRQREALDELRRLLDSDGERMSACDRGDLLDNVGWAAVLLAGASHAPDGAFDPRDHLARALALFRQACPDPNRVANTLENLALAELQRGRLAEASAALADAKQVEHDPGVPVVLFWLHLDGRIALASGDPRRAFTAFAREEEVAAALGSLDEQRTAAEDRADALLALGRKEDALVVLEAADALVDAGGALVPLGEGKEAFFGARDRAAMSRVKILVDSHRDADAMLAARRVRGRLLEGVRMSTALEHLDTNTHGRWEELAGRYRSARQAIDASAAHDWELSSDRLAEALERRRASAATARALLDEAFAVLSVPRVEQRRAPRPLLSGEIELL